MLLNETNNRYDDSSSISALAADTSYTTPPYNPGYINNSTRSQFVVEPDVFPYGASNWSHSGTSPNAADDNGTTNTATNASRHLDGQDINPPNQDSSSTHQHTTTMVHTVATPYSPPEQCRRRRSNQKGFPPAPMEGVREEDIPLVAATRILDDDGEPHGIIQPTVANTFAPSSSPTPTDNILPEGGQRLPSNLEEVIMDEPPPPRRRRAWSGEDIAAGHRSSSPNLGATYQDERQPTIADTMFDPDPRNPAHRLAWQTGRFSRAALKKTIRLTKDLPKHAASVQSSQAAQRSASFLRETSVKSAAFLQQTTIQAKDRTVDWYQKNDVGTKTKAAVCRVGHQIKHGSVTAYHTVRAWKFQT